MGDVSSQQRKRRRLLQNIVENVDAALRPIDDDYSSDANSDLNDGVGLSPGSGVDEDIRENVDVTLPETADDDSESYASLYSDFHFDGSSFNDSLYFSSDTDETFDEQAEAYFEDGGEPSFRQEIASWVLKYGVEHNKPDALLDLQLIILSYLYVGIFLGKIYRSRAELYCKHLER